MVISYANISRHNHKKTNRLISLRGTQVANKQHSLPVRSRFPTSYPHTFRSRFSPNSTVGNLEFLQKVKGAAVRSPYPLSCGREASRFSAAMTPCSEAQRRLRGKKGSWSRTARFGGVLSPAGSGSQKRGVYQRGCQAKLPVPPIWEPLTSTPVITLGRPLEIPRQARASRCSLRCRARYCDRCNCKELGRAGRGRS